MCVKAPFLISCIDSLHTTVGVITHLRGTFHLHLQLQPSLTQLRRNEAAVLTNTLGSLTG